MGMRKGTPILSFNNSPVNGISLRKTRAQSDLRTRRQEYSTATTRSQHSGSSYQSDSSDDGGVFGREAEKEVVETEIGFDCFLGCVGESAAMVGSFVPFLGIVGELHDDGVHEVIEYVDFAWLVGVHLASLVNPGKTCCSVSLDLVPVTAT